MMRIVEEYTAGARPPAKSFRPDYVHSGAVEVFFGDVLPSRRKLLAPDAVLSHVFLVRDDAEPGFLDQPQVHGRGLAIDHERALPEGDLPQSLRTGAVAIPARGHSM